MLFFIELADEEDEDGDKLLMRLESLPPFSIILLALPPVPTTPPFTCSPIRAAEADPMRAAAAAAAAASKSGSDMGDRRSTSELACMSLW